MSSQSLVEEIESLTPADRESVRQFVEYLKGRAQPATSPFLAAVDEFIDRHPELLRRLAQ
jgi:hypothetical protein